MSLILLPKYSISSDGVTLTVKDNTGQYSTTNVGGFDATGANNPKVSEVTVAQIKIAVREEGGEVGPETTVNAFPTLPSDIAGTFDISSTLGGQGGNYADAVYRLTYVVQGIWVSNGSVPFLNTSVLFVPIVPNICACWAKASADAAKCNCNCNDLDERFRRISLYVRELEAATEDGNVNAMQKFIDILTRICDEESCC